MFISINHIPVASGRESEFETMFRNRDRAIEALPGFVSIDVLRPGNKMIHGEPAQNDPDNEYQVLTRWLNEESFKNWLNSSEFKKSHSKEVDRTIFGGKSYLTLHFSID